MTTLKIYGDKLSGNCLKIKYTCDYLEIPYKWIDIDVVNGATRTSQFLKINPFGQVPVVDFGDNQILSQSNAIIKYIALGSSLIPEDKFKEAMMNQWLCWEQYSHEPAIAVLRYKKKYLKMNDSQVDPNLYKKSHFALQTMEKHLDSKRTPYFLETGFSLADISLLAYTRLAPEALLDLSSYKYICEWIERCENNLGIKPFVS